LDQNLIIEPLGPNHDRAAFSCGKDQLDDYLKKQARNSVEKNLVAVFILTPDRKKIAGYYTLSSYAVITKDIPDEIAKKLTRMNEVPATLIGRLARSLEFRGAGLGEILLVDALKRAAKQSSIVASWAVIVDAKDDEAALFYKRYGFIQFPTKSHRLFIPMSTVSGMYNSEIDEAAAPATPNQKAEPIS